MLRIEEIALDHNDEKANLPAMAAKILGIGKKELKSWLIQKRAIDSRRKNSIKIIYSLDLETADENALLEKLQKACAVKGKAVPAVTKHRIRKVEPFFYSAPKADSFIISGKKAARPVVIGCGPCGLFAALVLAEAGLNPLVLERGRRVDERVKDVNAFLKTGNLNPSSNIQFGEGGAGTFSDGKLYTLVNDPRSGFIYSELVNAGAPPEIAYDAKPHIGTDRLREVVKNLRKAVEKRGGEFRFDTCLSRLIIKNGRVEAAGFSTGEEISVSHIVAAVGHSARDTLEMFFRAGLEMEQKPFSIGVRIEHHRRMINEWQFGISAGSSALGAAKYKMAVHLPGGRSVYTFCMCPGGYVVPAASEPDMVVTNGMSEYAQDSPNSNSALLVNVLPGDFESSHPLAGIDFQRKWESEAYRLGGGGYAAPVQLAGDFLKGRRSSSLKSIIPTYKPGITMSDLSECLPSFVYKSLKDALPLFDSKIKGFACPDAVLTGVESRSSSPVRICRDSARQSNIKGIFPAGEGAGYAGGIISSAIDGMKAAEAVVADLINIKE